MRKYYCNHYACVYAECIFHIAKASHIPLEQIQIVECKCPKEYIQKSSIKRKDIADAYMKGWNDALDAFQKGEFQMEVAEQTEPSIGTTTADWVRDSTDCGWK